ncbi:MAG TPA: AraC family transcriptional regulator [Vicinamibacteria bacterium]|nr:AraC family transcriptional regulator [Vicinamibacteria bacterium]
MATRSSPVFNDHGRTYHADSCAPLVEAVRRGELRLEARARGSYPGRPLPGGVLRGLRCVGFWDASRKQTWGLPWHRNEGIELTYLETGSTGFALGQRRFVLQPGDLTITRPWQLHRVGTPDVGVGRLHYLILDVGVRQPHQTWSWPSWLVLSKEDLTDLTTALRGNEQPVWRADPQIQRCFRQLTGSLADDGPGEWSRLAVYINELLLQLVVMFRERRIPIRKSLSSARRSTELFLDSLRDGLEETWTLERMARSCGLGTTRFVHYCRQVTNQTPVQFLGSLRVEKACSLLRRDPTRSVTDIALDCGFVTSQYFATVFKRHCRCTPREYRQGRDRNASRQTRPYGGAREAEP